MQSGRHVRSTEMITGEDRFGYVRNDRHEMPNTYVVLEMGRGHERKRTAEVKGSTYPLYNESFSFPIEVHSCADHLSKDTVAPDTSLDC